MRTLHKFMLDTFTLPGVIAIGLLAGGSLLFFWFLWAIEQAHADNIVPRAISAAQHERCMSMPRGSQEMEENRHGCFKALYEGRWISITR